MQTISLPSFMRILTKGTPQKVSEYGRYLTPGGYDFYWRLKEAARAVTVDGDSYVKWAKQIAKSAREAERKHNLEGLKSLQSWTEKSKPEAFFDAPTGSCCSPEAFVTIKLEPEFGTVINGQHRIVQLWRSTGTRLTRTVAGVGIYLLQKHLCKDAFKDCKAGMLDLRKGELYLADALPPTIEAMVTSEFAWLDSFFKSYKTAA
jgi:hypothetical protein